MIGKATLEEFPKAKLPINKPLHQGHMDSFSSSVKANEGYSFSSSHHLSKLMKDIFIRSYFSMQQQGTDGFME
jgi:hypothetical protein